MTKNALSFLGVAIALIIFNGCVGNPSDELFLPEGVTLTKIRKHELTICKEVINDRDGNVVSKLSLLNGEISLKKVAYHEIHCIQSKPPYKKYVIPKEDWYKNYDHLFYRTHYETMRLRIEALENICSLADTLRIKCEEVEAFINEFNKYIIRGES